MTQPDIVENINCIVEGVHQSNFFLLWCLLMVMPCSSVRQRIFHKNQHGNQLNEIYGWKLKFIITLTNETAFSVYLSCPHWSTMSDLWDKYVHWYRSSLGKFLTADKYLLSNPCNRSHVFISMSINLFSNKLFSLRIKKYYFS